MTPAEIRLKCIELARPADLRNEHDAALIVARAKAFLAFVNEGAEVAPVKTLTLPGKAGDQGKATK